MPFRPDEPKVEAITKLLAGRSLREPSRDVLHRAYALKAMLPAPAPSFGAWLVELLFDSGMQPAPAGVRSGGSSERRLLYEAAAPDAPDARRQLDLRVRREAGGTVEVLGQCLPPWQVATVEVRSGRSRKVATIDDAGEFLLRGISAKNSPLVLTLTVDGRPLLVIESVPLPDAPSQRS